jgi:phosphate transport system substrate-binding protein
MNGSWCVRGVVFGAVLTSAMAGCNRSGDANAPARAGSAAPAAAAGPTRITIAGSSALVPLATEAANRYMRAHSDVTIQVTAGGSRQGLAQVGSGAVTIGDSDVFAAAA